MTNTKSEEQKQYVERARKDALFNYANELAELPSKLGGLHPTFHFDNGLKAGHDACLKSPVVLGLVEALEFYAEGRHLEVPDFKNHLTHTEVIDDGDVARSAVAAYRSEVSDDLG